METRGEVDRSFERLYHLHRREVYGVALRELGNVQDAEDVTQAAFVDAYRAILRGSRPESPRAWLLAIAENVLRRRFRAARRRPTEHPVAAEALPAPELPREQAQALLSALESLAPLQREVFLLREIRGLSYEEIAARAGASVGAVQMLLFRARQALRSALEPPSTAGRARVLSLPVWLLQLAARADRSLLTPRGVGAVGAAALVLGASAGGPVEVSGDSSARPPFQSTDAAPIARDEVRAATVAESGPVPRPVRPTVVPERSAARNDVASAPVAPAPEVSTAPVVEPEPATAEPTAMATTVTAAEVEAPVSEAPTRELPPLAEVGPALPAPPEVPLTPIGLPQSPPVESTLPPFELPPLEPPPLELPPVELPPVPPTQPPLQPPRTTPPVPLP